MAAPRCVIELAIGADELSRLEAIARVAHGNRQPGWSGPSWRVVMLPTNPSRHEPEGRDGHVPGGMRGSVGNTTCGHVDMQAEGVGREGRLRRDRWGRVSTLGQDPKWHQPESMRGRGEGSIVHASSTKRLGVPPGCGVNRPTRNARDSATGHELSRGENRPDPWGEPAQLAVIPWGEPAKLLVKNNYSSNSLVG